MMAAAVAGRVRRLIKGKEKKKKFERQPMKQCLGKMSSHPLLSSDGNENNQIPGITDF